MDDLFDRAVQKIEREYVRLGHSLGWRFLYSPRRTLTADVPLMFAATNPGGRIFEDPRPSVEDGNAYRVERWRNGRMDPLQQRVCRLLSEIAEKTAPSLPSETFIDGTLSANFCPFRSGSWAELYKKRESIDSSEDLWRLVFKEVVPKVILADGREAAWGFRRTLDWCGFSRRSGPVAFRTGWGDVSYYVTSLTRGQATTYLFDLPHLSRFDIRGVAEREGLLRRVADAFA